MTNSQIADQFSLLSKLMDLHGEDSFKAKSYGSAAFNIEKLPAEITTMSEGELFSMKGIGKSTGAKILELLNTGKLQALEDIIAATPPGVLDMMQIKGLGPKKLAVIWRELGAESIGELEYACNENRLVTLKGFGAKTQDSILQSIAYIRQNEGFYLWSEANAIAAAIQAMLVKAYPGARFLLAGAIKRQMETIDCIDMVTDADATVLEQQFRDMADAQVATEDAGKMSVVLPGQPRLMLHFAGTGNVFLAQFMATGSDAFLQAFKERYTLPDSPENEEAIFIHSKLQYIPPALREDAAILDAAANNAIPELITGDDVKGIIHSHSTWSDGLNTIEEMANAAIEKGLEYLVLSDHSQAAFYANGLTPERIAQQHAEIDKLNAKLAPFKIFKSIEADILNDGSLDYSDSVLATFDLVIASVHSNLKMSEEKAMARVMAAIANPYTTILGHPTGRLLLSRKGYPLDHKAIIDACAQHNVVIEINAHPRRLDLDWRWIQYAMQKGVLLSIDPDAHSINGYKDVYYGAFTAQKGGLTPEHNLSSYTLAQFEDFLSRTKEKKGLAVM